MNRYNIEYGHSNQFVARLPQSFNGKVWMLEVATVANMIRFCVYDTDQHNSDPVSATFEFVSRKMMDELCTTNKTHQRIELNDEIEEQPAKLILIANHKDKICSTNDILVLFQHPHAQLTQLIMSKALFAQ